MSEQDQRELKMTELIRAAAHHSWDAVNKDNKLKHRRHFEELGIKSPEQLSVALQKAARSHETRSFERAPNPKRGETERSLIMQTKIQDQQGKKRDLTIILNPNRDNDGRVHGGTAYTNDPKRVTDIHKRLQDEWKRGHDPQISLRGPVLSQSEKGAVKTPAYRLRDRYDLNKPTLERDKQVTPVQEREDQGRKAKEHTTLLQRLQQAKPDISKEVGERERQRQITQGYELGR